MADEAGVLPHALAHTHTHLRAYGYFYTKQWLQNTVSFKFISYSGTL